LRVWGQPGLHSESLSFLVGLGFELRVCACKAGALLLEALHFIFFCSGYFGMGSWKYLPGLTSNHDPPDLCLLSSLDYRCEARGVAQVVVCLPTSVSHCTWPSFPFFRTGSLSKKKSGSRSRALVVVKRQLWQIVHKTLHSQTLPQKTNKKALL
jgi:hypothetical protein